MTHVTCRLTAKKRDQLRNPTLGNRIWATFFGLIDAPSTDQEQAAIYSTPQPPVLRLGYTDRLLDSSTARCASSRIRRRDEPVLSVDLIVAVLHCRVENSTARAQLRRQHARRAPNKLSFRESRAEPDDTHRERERERERERCETALGDELGRRRRRRGDAAAPRTRHKKTRNQGTVSRPEQTGATTTNERFDLTYRTNSPKRPGLRLEAFHCMHENARFFHFRTPRSRPPPFSRVTLVNMLSAPCLFNAV